MNETKIKALVIDDKSLFRKIISKALSDIEGIEVVGVAGNASIALNKIAQFKPEVITLDIEMPLKDSLAILRALKESKVMAETIMVSSFTKARSSIVHEVIELGSSHFVSKPETGIREDDYKALEHQLQTIIKSIISKKDVRNIIQKSATSSKKERDERTLSDVEAEIEIEKNIPVSRNGKQVQIVAIGISTGGPNALAEVIPKFPVDFPVPVVIVQHMPPEFTKVLATSLNKKSSLNVIEAVGGETLEPGTVYIAPGGKQLKVTMQKNSKKAGIEITDDPPEHFCKPSIDYLFRSVADSYGASALGVIMTGMGSDGIDGLRIMKDKGAIALAQDEESSIVFGMPGEAIKAGVVDSVVSLDRMANSILRVIARKN